MLLPTRFSTSQCLVISSTIGTVRCSSTTMYMHRMHLHYSPLAHVYCIGVITTTESLYYRGMSLTESCIDRTYIYFLQREWVVQSMIARLSENIFGYVAFFEALDARTVPRAKRLNVGPRRKPTRSEDSLFRSTVNGHQRDPVQSLQLESWIMQERQIAYSNVLTFFFSPQSWSWRSAGACCRKHPLREIDISFT